MQLASTCLDLYLYYSESEHFDKYHNKSNLLWHEPNIVFGNWYDGEFSDGSLKISSKLLIFLSDYVKISSKNMENSPRISSNLLNFQLTKGVATLYSCGNPVFMSSGPNCEAAKPRSHYFIYLCIHDVRTQLRSREATKI